MEDVQIKIKQIIINNITHKIKIEPENVKNRACDQHGLGSKPTRVILLCPWERHFAEHSPAWWSWQAVLNYSNISIKSINQSIYLCLFNVDCHLNTK